MRRSFLGSLSFLLLLPAAAPAATLTFTNAGDDAFDDARVSGVLNGYQCDGQRYDFPATIVIPSENGTAAGSGLCPGDYVAHGWLKFAAMNPYGVSGEGSADAAYLGGGTGFVADGRSAFATGFTSDEDVTVRVHVAWHKQVGGAAPASAAQFTVNLCTGTCAGNILSALDTSPADGDVTVDQPISAATSYHLKVTLATDAATNPFDGNQPAVSSSGSYSVTMELASIAGVGRLSATTPILGPALPNPARAGIDLALALPKDSDVTFDVVDLAGRSIARSGHERDAAGVRTLHWDGRDASGHPALPGMYFAAVSVDGHRLPARSVLLVR